MKRPDLKPNKLYTESEMAENFTSAVLQGIAMCMTTLEWHYNWRGKRLSNFYENVKAIAEMPPIFGKAPSVKEQKQHLLDAYGIDLNCIQLQIEVADESGNVKGMLKK